MVLIRVGGEYALKIWYRDGDWIELRDGADHVVRRFSMLDDFTVIGSANLSLESLMYHDELSLLIYNNELQKQILAYLKQSILESRFKRFLKGPRRKYSKEIPEGTTEQ